MPHVIHHPHTVQTHHNLAWYILITLAVTLVAILTITLAPTITINEPISVRITSGLPYPDYALRHPELIQPFAAPADTTDYYFRQLQINIPANTDDTTDYHFRH